MLSTKEIEEHIAKYNLKFPKTRDERVEWGLRFPMFVSTFLKMIDQNGIVPSQDEFVERYFSDNAGELAHKLTSPQLKTGLEARLRRTYPSLVRDLHFAALLREHGLNVVYDSATDIESGVDHVIEYKGTKFNLHCYAKTAAGTYSRRMKNRRHKFTGFHLDVPLDLQSDRTRKVGDFFLYSEKHIESLIVEMESKLGDAKNQTKERQFK